VNTDKVYLVGFMTAGKSTVARALATRLDWRLFDLDLEIEARERKAVAEIFATRGEARFRELEREALARLVPVRHAVVATGGGTFVDPFNRAAILADGCSFWLDVSFNVRSRPIARRWKCSSTRAARPTSTHMSGLTPRFRPSMRSSRKFSIASAGNVPAGQPSLCVGPRHVLDATIVRAGARKRCLLRRYVGGVPALR
jgi:shikimate kinase